jgi:hypothetical protein
MYDILQSEVGYQLMFGKGEAPIWTRVEVFRVPQAVYRQWEEGDVATLAAFLPPFEVPGDKERVLRLHHKGKDGGWLATDLYTGIVFDANQVEEAMLSVLYARFPPEFQILMDEIDENT